MIRKLIIALCMSLAFANAAFAQSFPKPPDVPAYVPVSVSYAAGSTANVRGDGSNAWGGTPPAYAYQNTDIPTPSRLTGWIATGTWATDHTGFCPIGVSPALSPRSASTRTSATFSMTTRSATTDSRGRAIATRSSAIRGPTLIRPTPRCGTGAIRPARAARPTAPPTGIRAWSRRCRRWTTP
jgi:hypothetical protein